MPTGSQTAADALAGVTSRTFAQAGPGTFTTVPGTVRGPGSGREITVGFQIEKGLNIDGPVFARFALDTLNDDRSWHHDGVRFSQVAPRDAQLVIKLATPETSARLCLPLRTMGTLSCRANSAVIFTVYRWVKGLDEYNGDLTGYRQYLVNHEVGHFLGHGHVFCPGPGEPAPVMLQQTKGLNGCTPNSWPYP